MWYIICDSLTVYTVLCVICMCLSPGQCHMKTRDRSYHISRSCRPICTTGETCVVYRTLSRVTVARCVKINIHRYRLEGTRLVLKTHSHPRRQPQQPPAHIPLRPDYLTHQHGTANNALQPNGRVPNQYHTGIDIPQPVRTRTDRPSHVAGVPRFGETVPPFVRPRDNKIALRETMQRVYRKTGIRPDTNSRLVNFKLNGFPSRKVDVMLPINNVMDTAEKGVVPTPSELQINKIDPIPENQSPAVSATEDQSCQSCAETTTCPDGEYCYHSTQCGIMICQPLQ